MTHVLAILGLAAGLALWVLLQAWIRRQSPGVRSVEDHEGGCCGSGGGCGRRASERGECKL